MARNGKFLQNWWNLGNPYQSQGEKWLFQTVSGSGQKPEANGSSIRTVDLCPIKTPDSVRLSLHACSIASPQRALKHPMSIGQTQSSFVLWEALVTALGLPQGSSDKGNWCLWTGVLFLLCLSELEYADLYRLWQDSLWKPKLRPRSPSALSGLLFPSPQCSPKSICKKGHRLAWKCGSRSRIWGVTRRQNYY